MTHLNRRQLFTGLLGAGLLAAGFLRPSRCQAGPPVPAHRQPWLLFPVDPFTFKKISSVFGSRTMDGGLEHHAGLDIAAPSGTTIVAAREGEVEAAATHGRAGNYVRIRHTFGWVSVYCHMLSHADSLKVGSPVRAGQKIGFVGSTGRSTGPHLHFGLKAPAVGYLDPLPHLYTPAESWALLAPFQRRS